MSGDHVPRRRLRHAEGGRGWHLNGIALGAALVAWIGLAVLLYPSAASWFSLVEQSRIVTSYTEEVDAGTDPPAAEQLRKANEYNRALRSGAVLEANQRLPSGRGVTNSRLDYDALLRTDASDVMARIQIPAIGVDLPVFHGTSDETLLRGVGHLQGTSLPVGGVDSHSVLTGHRGLATAAMFTDLNLVKVGDTFIISVLDQVLVYRVVSSTVVEPNESEALRPVAGRDLVTLVTCTPLGINSQRILVTGERVLPNPVSDVAAATTVPHPGFPWWAVALCVGTLLDGGYVWRSGNSIGRAKAGGATVPAVLVAPEEGTGAA